jgi:drug/metabolite transporter (DMT)-like permease
MISGSVLLLLVSLLTGKANRFDWTKVSTQSFLAWSYLVIFGAIIGFTAYVLADSRLSTVVVRALGRVDDIRNLAIDVSVSARLPRSKVLELARSLRRPR